MKLIIMDRGRRQCSMSTGSVVLLERTVLGKPLFMIREAIEADATAGVG